MHVSDGSSVHHQEFFTIHTGMVYVIQVCWQLTNRIRTDLSWSCSQAFGWFYYINLSRCTVTWTSCSCIRRNCKAFSFFFVWKNLFQSCILHLCLVAFWSLSVDHLMQEFATNLTKLYQVSINNKRTIYHHLYTSLRRFIN